MQLEKVGILGADIERVYSNREESSGQDFTHTILSEFGPNLKTLWIRSVTRLDVEHLVNSCPNLEYLFIQGFCTIITKPSTMTSNLSDALPVFKCIKSEVPLDSWSPFFEKKTI